MLCWRLVVMVGMVVGALLMRPGAAWTEIGQIKTVTGTVSLVRNNVQLPAKAGDVLAQEDILTTGPDSSVGITFIDNSRFSLGPNSYMALQQFRFNPTTHDGASLTEVRRGTLAVISGQMAKRSPEAMKVKTPTTILGVRGTKFAVQVTE